MLLLILVADHALPQTLKCLTAEETLKTGAIDLVKLQEMVGNVLSGKAIMTRVAVALTASCCGAGVGFCKMWCSKEFQGGETSLPCDQSGALNLPFGYMVAGPVRRIARCGCSSSSRFKSVDSGWVPPAS